MYAYQDAELESLLKEFEGPGLANPPFSPDSPLVQAVRPANLGCGMERDPTGSLRTRTVPDVTHVVIHIMVGNFEATVRSWESSTSGQGCFKPHYAIRNDGFIAQVVPERLIPQHGNAANLFSIGIEHDGFAADPS